MYFILCADDYGQYPHVTQGIVQLLQHNKLNAVSCLVTQAQWPADAQLLHPFKNKVQLGLHLNLTKIPGAPALPKLLLQAHLRLLNHTKIAAEINRQLDLFIQHLGKAPDFIDGHQHVHHLPIIRDALLNIYLNRFPEKNVWLRISSNSLWRTLTTLRAYPKNIVIALTGALQLKKRCQQLGIAHNKSFSGIYNFAQAAQFPVLFTKFLDEIKENGLIMCHPGAVSHNTNDALALSRPLELAFLLQQKN